MTETIESLLDDLVVANHILAHEGVLDVFGHISVRDPGDPGKFYLSCSRSPGLVTRTDLMEFDLDGTVLAGGGHPYLERFIHSGIYSLRPDVQSVVHHHAGPVLPFAVTGKPLRPVFHLGSVAGLQSSLWDSQDDFGDTAMLITSHKMGLSLARSLGQGPTGLLKRHGAVCAGTSIQHTTFIAVCMRDNADLLLKSLAIGDPDYLTEGEVDKAQKLHSGGRPVERAWEFWKSRVPSE